jgi:hypothetical protein
LIALQTHLLRIPYILYQFLENISIEKKGGYGQGLTTYVLLAGFIDVPSVIRIPGPGYQKLTPPDLLDTDELPIIPSILKCLD